MAGQVIAIDEDNNTSLTFLIINGNINDAFEFSETGGKLNIKNDQAIDFEINPVFNLKIKVLDSKNKSTLASVTINLVDVSPPSNGLLLYYPFDGNTNDASGNINNAINYTSNNYVTGKWLQALDFNGTSDYLKLTNTINSDKGLSFSFWLNTRGVNGTENNGTIIGKYNMASNIRCFLVNSFGVNTTRADNYIGVGFFKYGNTSSFRDDVFSNMEPSDLSNYSNPELWTLVDPKQLITNVWSHCVINVTTSDIEIWINGGLCTKKTREYNSYFINTTEPTYIGNILSGGAGNTNHFNGALDELRIYSGGLTMEEIKTLFKEK